MTKLTWDQPEQRIYETGIDRGVLYLDGFAMPWNGLTSVKHNVDNQSNEPLYFDGTLLGVVPSVGVRTSEISALTFPEEFLEYTGYLELETGLSISQQHTKPFSMSYRSLVGDELLGLDMGYKIHILYNLVAKPGNISNVTNTSNVDIIEFSWTTTNKPEIVSGFLPTAYAVADSRYLDPGALLWIENILYGTSTAAPYLPSLSALISTLSSSFIITITDNGNGTWTAEGPDEYFVMLTATTFQITGLNVTVLDANTYNVSST